MKLLLMIVASALACAACAPAAPRADGGGGGHVEMYGTLDNGITVHD